MVLCRKFVYGSAIKLKHFDAYAVLEGTDRMYPKNIYFHQTKTQGQL